jgi:leucyl aminopeptidase (aminopeptidase T)
MRTTVFVATALVGALLGFAADTTTSTQPPTKKKSAGKAATKSHSTAAHSTATHSTSHTTARKAVAKKGKKGSARPVVPARSRQTSPTPERYQEIQQALASKGYLPAEQANGQWSDGSAAALKRFQADQNLDATGKINSLSLIALGLGPKHETAKPVGTAPAPPPTPQQP